MEPKSCFRIKCDQKRLFKNQSNPFLGVLWPKGDYIWRKLFSCFYIVLAYKYVCYELVFFKQSVRFFTKAAYSASGHSAISTRDKMADNLRNLIKSNNI